jgi:tRNA pseudouridine55 synthase
VRSLVRDLGEALGCGAHVGELRRLWVEPFRQPAMLTIERLAAEAESGYTAPWLLPLEAGLIAFPRIELSSGQAQQLRRGIRLPGFDGLSKGLHTAFADDGRAVALVQLQESGLLASIRVFKECADILAPSVR